MSKLLYQPRYKCALAAMQTVHAIPRAIPILHAGPGCGAKLNDNNGTSGMYSPNIFPCTSISEKEVVFGGNDKLRVTIENALKIIDADLFVVLTGCTPEIIGDDVEEVVKEFSTAGKKVVYVNTPGFKGNNYKGHDWVLQGVLSQYLSERKASTQKGLVNIFSAPPMQDAFWLGNMREIESLVSSLGLAPNTIFGHGRGLPNMDKIPDAELNILIGPWSGLETIKFLQKKFGVPYLHCPALPIGAFETSKFLREVAEKTSVKKELCEKIISEYESEYYYYIERYSDIFLEQRIMSKRFVTVADSHYALAFTKFLVNDLGMFPSTQYITDDAPQEHRDLIQNEFNDLNYGIKAKVVFSTDGAEIHNQIKNTAFGGNPLIIGSSWEKRLASQINGIFVNVSYPMVSRMVINGCIAGYSGGLKALEDMYTEARERLAL
ncbi:MAG: hydrogenase [Spirochaetaceae bacterium]|nr:hydrogenase [Spirochaetaceae bacterium]